MEERMSREDEMRQAALIQQPMMSLGQTATCTQSGLRWAAMRRDAMLDS